MGALAAPLRPSPTRTVRRFGLVPLSDSSLLQQPVEVVTARMAEDVATGDDMHEGSNSSDEGGTAFHRLEMRDAVPPPSILSPASLSHTRLKRNSVLPACALTEDPHRSRFALRGDGLIDVTINKAHAEVIGIELAHSAEAGTYILNVIRGSRASRIPCLSKGVGVRSVNRVAVGDHEHAASIASHAAGDLQLCVTHDVVAKGRQGWSIFQAPCI